MSKDDDILLGIKEIKESLSDIVKINNRVIVLEESSKQVKLDLKDLKKGKADAREFKEFKNDFRVTGKWWKELLRTVAAVVIAALILGYMNNNMRGESNEKESTNSTSTNTSP